MYGYFFSPVYIKFPHLSETYIYVAVYINAEFDVHRREVKKKDISLLYICLISKEWTCTDQETYTAKPYLKCYAQQAQMLNTRF